jgi:hypothetical protein
LFFDKFQKREISVTVGFLENSLEIPHRLVIMNTER